MAVDRAQYESWHGMARGNSRVQAEMIDEIASLSKRLDTLTERVADLERIILELAAE